MPNTRIKIDLEHGILEVEGSESFVRSIYDEFKEQLHRESGSGSNSAPKQKKVKGAPKRALGGSGTRKKGASKKKPPKFLKDLNLSGGKGLQSLKDFYSMYITTSNLEKNLVFTYYLVHIMELTGVTLDHLFTCYRTVGEKVPGALDQSLRDTSFKKHWDDTSSLEDIKLSTPGINFIEHDMPRAEVKS